MNVAFISDLHIDLNESFSEADFQTVFQRLTDEKEVQQWVIGGDISNHYRTTFSFVEKLQKTLGVPVWFIPGNHDYWEKEASEKHTRDVYQSYAAHPQCLLENPLELSEDTVLFGHSGWYNYAFAAESFSKEELANRHYNERTWQDKLHTNWEENDQALSKLFAEKVNEQMIAYPNHKKVLMTHMVTIPEFSVRLPHPVFDYFNAFIGTDDFDSVIESHQPSHVLMGHVHYRRVLEKAETYYVCCCLGYTKEWRSDDLYQEMQAATYVLSLE